MPDSTVTDLRRELEKAHAALAAAETHLARHAEMNAALHCSERVMYSPLHAKVTAAIHGIEHALSRTDHTNPPANDSQNSDIEWAALVADLDRCKHGRHEGDDCGDTCGTRSQGNPYFRPGDVIGYGLYGEPIVMPTRDDKHDPAAWRPNSTRRGRRA